MGRKSIDRPRKPLTQKTKVWVRELVPLLQHRSLDRLTLDELVELTGRSKSTIYSYFSTKEEIFKTAVHLILDDMKDVIASEAMKSEDDMEQVYRSMLIKISVGIEGISIGFLEQIKQHFPEVWLIIEAFIGQVLTNLESIYRKGMQSGDFKRFNISLLTALDNHFVMSIMTNTAKFQGQGMSLNDLVTEYLELRLSALKK